MMGVWSPAKKFKGGSGKAIGKSSAGVPVAGTTGEIRFEDAASAQLAMQKLSGSSLGGVPITLEWDPSSKDETKLLVSDLPPGTEWQELKDHFAVIGNVAFANVNGVQTRGQKFRGEVRFETTIGAAQALSLLQGSSLMGSTITLDADPTSKDGTKLIVTGIAPGTGWQELKDHFAQVGHPLAFANVSSVPSTGACCCIGEVRFDDPDHAKMAMTSLNGSTLDGATIFIQAAPNSKDNGKLIVSGLAPSTQWQELKDHFAVVGPVAFAEVASMAKLQQFSGGNKGCMKGNMMLMNGQFLGASALAHLFKKNPKGGGGKGGGKAADNECWDVRSKGFCPRTPKCKWCNSAIQQ
eukprot:TRINITY_DN13500_c0_g1_i1.p1 TRINITY_DN13500_c0_g1~~TRINITY_DN13500_c0_g1_i1.p1  ORF type:complete len:352 (-),score=80.47 TRINITY_DN13500_c0_g1_i1:61-1116(-)